MGRHPLFLVEKKGIGAQNPKKGAKGRNPLGPEPSTGPCLCSAFVGARVAGARTGSPGQRLGQKDDSQLPK